MLLRLLPQFFFLRHILFWDCSALSPYRYIIISFRRCHNISKEMLINEQIRDREVRLVDDDGSQLGVLPVVDAQKIAYDKNLDLVKIAPQAKPPVCKIMDYGKYRFEMTKKDKEAKKKQKVINVKEVRLSPSIDEHDFVTKLNHARKFLQAGDKVKASVRFRGREMRHTDLGENVLKKFAEAVAEVGNVEKNPKLDGRHMTMFISPKQ